MHRDKRLLIAGVDGTDGIGFAIARRALLDGAHVTLTAPARDFERCRRATAELPPGAHAVLVDIERDDDLAALAEHLRCGYGRLDGAVHADASAPAAARAALERTLRPFLEPSGGALVDAAAGDDLPARVPGTAMA